MFAIIRELTIGARGLTNQWGNHSIPYPRLVGGITNFEVALIGGINYLNSRGGHPFKEEAPGRKPTKILKSDWFPP